MSNPITRLKAALEGHYRVEREIDSKFGLVLIYSMLSPPRTP